MPALDLTPSQSERVVAGLCACGCGAPVPPGQTYFLPKCRQKASRQRKAYRAEVARQRRIEVRQLVGAIDQLYTRLGELLDQVDDLLDDGRDKDAERDERQARLGRADALLLRHRGEVAP